MMSIDRYRDWPPEARQMLDKMTPGQINELSARLIQMANMLAALPKEAKELIVELSNQVTQLRADVERIGEEFATMRNANAELQERLSVCEDDLK